MTRKYENENSWSSSRAAEWPESTKMKIPALVLEQLNDQKYENENSGSSSRATEWLEVYQQ